MENDQWLGIETTQDQGCITVGESFSYDIGGNSKGVMAKYDALGGANMVCLLWRNEK